MDSKTQTWLTLAQEDLDFAQDILKNGRRPHYAAHFCHQSIEKLLKAIVQAMTQETPIPTHNFKTLCKQASLELPPTRMEWLLNLAPHYLGTRYPEDLFELRKQYSQQVSETLHQETKEFFTWLRSTYLK
jgi:HEPN domain-containing protein